MFTKCRVSKAARLVSPKPDICCKFSSQGGKEKDHSLGDMVIKIFGKPNCLTQSIRQHSCHFQYSGLNVFACNDVAGEHDLCRAVVIAPETVLNNQMS